MQIDLCVQEQINPWAQAQINPWSQVQIDPWAHAGAYRSLSQVSDQPWNQMSPGVDWPLSPGDDDSWVHTQIGFGTL